MNSIAKHLILAIVGMASLTLAQEPQVLHAVLETSDDGQQRILNLADGTVRDTGPKEEKQGDLLYDGEGFGRSLSPFKVLPPKYIAEIVGANVAVLFDSPQPSFPVAQGSYLVVRLPDGRYAVVLLHQVNRALANLYWVLNEKPGAPFKQEDLTALANRVTKDAAHPAPVLSGSATLVSLSKQGGAKGFLFDGGKLVDIPDKPLETATYPEKHAYTRVIREQCDITYDAGPGGKRGVLHIGTGLSGILGTGTLEDFAGHDLSGKLGAKKSTILPSQYDRGTVIVVQTQSRRYALVRVDATGEDFLTIHWIYQPDGTAQFPKVAPAPAEEPVASPASPPQSRQDLDDALFEFCRAQSAATGDDREKKLKTLVQAGANVNMRTEHGATPLSDAVFRRDTNIVHLLVEAGADVNLLPVLCSAAANGDYETAKYLLEHGANIDCLGASGLTPLQLALQGTKRDERLIRLLKNAGSNAKSIFVAIETGDVNAVKALIAGGSDVNQFNQTGEAPIHVAARTGNVDIAGVLIAAKADLAAVTKGRKENAAVLAARFGHKDVMSLLVPTLQNELKSKALYEAAARGRADICGVLLDSCTNVHEILQQDAKVVEGILYWGATNVVDLFASKGMRLPFGVAVRLGRVSLMDEYLKSGSDVNAAISILGTDTTPLQIGIQKGKRDAVRWLLTKGADPNRSTQGVGAPLLMAVEQGDRGLVSLLLEHKANPNLQANDGMTPLLCAVDRNDHETAALLLERGADPNLSLRVPPEKGVPPSSRSLLGRARDGKMKDLLKEHGAK